MIQLLEFMVCLRLDVKQAPGFNTTHLDVITGNSDANL